MKGPAFPQAPSRPFHGNAEAQDLMRAINDLNDSMVATHGAPFFHREPRKDYIMTLPTAEGWKVLQAMGRAALVYSGVDLHKILRDMAIKRWKALRSAVLHKLGERDCVEHSPFDPGTEAAVDQEKWDQLERKKREAARAQSLVLNPGLAWRTGRPDVFPNPGAFEIHVFFISDPIVGLYSNVNI